MISKKDNELLLAEKLHLFKRKLKVDREKLTVLTDFRKKRKFFFDKKKEYAFKFETEEHLEKFLLEFDVHRKFVDIISDK